MKMLAVLALLLLAVSAQAQTNDAWPPADRPLADYLSTADLLTIAGIDVGHSVYVGHQQGTVWQALGCEGLKFGIANGVTLVLKHFIPEERPNGVDNQSFPSEHSANAFAATGWTWQASIPIAASVAYLRTAANWHWWHDVAVGAVIGLISRYAVTRIPACQGVS
jgi:membrane-associated phospholipid phosphatase